MWEKILRRLVVEEREEEMTEENNFSVRGTHKSVRDTRSRSIKE